MTAAYLIGFMMMAITYATCQYTMQEQARSVKKYMEKRDKELEKQEREISKEANEE